MKIVVCVKQVNDEVNPFDACALECALGIENADVTVVSMGRPQVFGMLKAFTRLGVNRAILLTDSVFAGGDTLATSYVLAQAIKKLKPDLIICGRQSIDGDTGQVGPCLSQMLGYSLITNVMKIHTIGNKISCVSRMGEERGTLPALITVEKINILRFPSIGAKAKEVEIWTANDINADAKRCGQKGSPTKVLETHESNMGKRKCRFIRADKLLSIINDSKNQRINRKELKQSDKKFNEVWIVGEELRQIALTISENVRVIDERLPEKIAELAQIYNPRAILWKADLWGKRNAPIAAALLQTGLCADCTSLETNGERLYMYRPAFGGSVMAKIECKTYPQMASIRIVEESENEIIVAGGRGAKDSFNLLKCFSEKINAKPGASRGLVDMGIAPYEMQIGLTGKSVNPRIYIACGISGTVQHTCAIEQAGIVIAINTDKNARIFDYADFGIVADVNDVLKSQII